MHYPELIPRTANRNIVPLLVQISWPCIDGGQPPIVWRSIYHRKEDHIPFVTLKLGRVAAQQSMFRKDTG